MAGARAVQWSVGGGGGAGAICHDQQEAALSHMHNTQQQAGGCTVTHAQHTANNNIQTIYEDIQNGSPKSQNCGNCLNLESALLLLLYY